VVLGEAIHTVVWEFFVSCIKAVPVAALT